VGGGGKKREKGKVEKKEMVRERDKEFDITRRGGFSRTGCDFVGHTGENKVVYVLQV
jgi:hypothetical protein